MPLFTLRVVVQMPVMAFREDGHAVHVRLGEGLRKPFRLEINSHVTDQRRRVEIQMHLAKWKHVSLVKHCRSSALCGPNAYSDVQCDPRQLPIALTSSCARSLFCCRRWDQAQTSRSA